MSQASSNSTPVEQLETAASIVNVTELVEQNGTVPFLGVNENVDAEYPEAINARGRRYVDDDEQRSFKTALSVLPNAGEGELWADNEFVSPSEGESVDVNLDAIRNVHGLDIEDLERRTGMDLETMVQQADPEALVGVETHKDIIDRRRLALRTLGFDVRFRWQIASSRYSPGDMREFFKRKIAACQKHGAENAFGWIRHYDWGGSVTLTTIYPSKAYEIDPADDTDIDLQNGELTIAGGEDFDEGDIEEGEPTTIYYGDQLKYDFRGRQKLSVTPVIYIPEVDTMIPLPHPEADLARKHTGNLMEDAIDWHETVLSTLDALCETVNQEIKRARLVAIDFMDLPFNVEEFYSYIGVQNEDYIEAAADRATALAKPSHQPTLWNLQLSLKLAILDNFDGNRAGKTYREYQELAGEILRHPATMITTAKEQFRLEADKEDGDDGVDLDNEQTTLAESLEDVMDLTGVTENQIDATDAQQIERRVQQRLPNSGGKA
jgi:hypothetical protein